MITLYNYACLYGNIVIYIGIINKTLEAMEELWNILLV